MLISKLWGMRTNSNKDKAASKTDFESILSIEAIVFVVSEFLDEKDLSNYMLVSKKIHQKILSNSKIQIRVLNVKLLNARLELHRLREDPHYREKKKLEKKELRKLQADKITEPLLITPLPASKNPNSRKFISLMLGNLIASPLTSSDTNTTMTVESPPNNTFTNKSSDPVTHRPKTSTTEMQMYEKKREGVLGLRETQEFIQVWAPAPDSIDYYSEKLSEISTELKSHWIIGPTASVISNLSGKHFCPVWISKNAVQKVQGLLS